MAKEICPMIASQEPEKWLRECLPRLDGRQVAMDYDAKAATNFIEVATLRSLRDFQNLPVEWIPERRKVHADLANLGKF